jgi:hypothetical protein
MIHPETEVKIQSFVTLSNNTAVGIRAGASDMTQSRPIGPGDLITRLEQIVPEPFAIGMGGPRAKYLKRRRV